MSRPLTNPPLPKPPPAGPAVDPATIHLLGVGLDAGLVHSIRPWASELRAQIEFVPDLPHAVRKLAAGHWDVVLTVLGDHPDEDLHWWANALRGRTGAPRLIAFAHRPSMGLALRAEQLGTHDLLSLPVHREELLRSLRRVGRGTSEVAVPLEAEVEGDVGRYALVGQSQAMLEVYKLIARVAPSTATVLIQGESGTGKEVVARAIHANGPKATGPFVALNCAAIPENLLESELFGHEKGAFSGAVTRKIGRFELARGGTLFLDEIADMTLPLQAKILRAVQEREIERVGGGDPIPVDVRLIAASNRELRDAIQQGRFREDLYYRLAVVVVRLPRLAERGGDMALLAAYFARQFGGQYGKSITGFSDRALELLAAHRWVGNVRELRNVIEQAVIVATGDTVLVEHLPDEIRGQEGTLAGTMAGELATLAEAEARHIARVLAHTGGQIGAAATILGIHRNTLTRKIREYGL